MFRLLLSLVLAMATAAAQAQDWPAKPVRVVVAFAPGGSLDFVTRIISERLSQDLGQTFLVENRAGANGNVGADIVAKLPGDGYVILASADALPSSAHLYKLNYDPMKDLVPVIQFTRQPLVLAVHPSLNVGTVAELIALAKTRPGMGYATSGAGSGQHMAGEWLAKLAGIKLTHVPYKGGGQAIHRPARRPGADRVAGIHAGDPAPQDRQAEDPRPTRHPRAPRAAGPGGCRRLARAVRQAVSRRLRKIRQAGEGTEYQD